MDKLITSEDMCSALNEAREILVKEKRELEEKNAKLAERLANQTHRLGVVEEKLNSATVELEFTRRFIHSHGLEFALAAAWAREKQKEGK